MTNNSKLSGIYQIVNTNTRESYVGSSNSVYKRLRDHMVDLVGGIHINRLLQLSWNHHKPDAFIFSVLEVASEDVLPEREIFWIKKLRAVEDGFNVKSDMEKSRTLMKIDYKTKEILEDLDMGPINTALQILLKVHKKHHGK